MTNEERISKMNAVSCITSDKIASKLAEIKSLSTRMNSLVEVLNNAKKNGFCVEKFFTSNHDSNSMYISYCALYFRVPTTDYEKYWIVDKNGDVFTSDYACKYENSAIIPSDTFKVGEYRSQCFKEETRLATLNKLETIIDTFLTVEDIAYKEIDAQIESKVKELDNKTVEDNKIVESPTKVDVILKLLSDKGLCTHDLARAYWWLEIENVISCFTDYENIDVKDEDYEEVITQLFEDDEVWNNIDDTIDYYLKKRIALRKENNNG